MKKERGSALILTIIIMLVLVVIGGALAVFGMVEVRQAQREEDELQAYYLARSAVDAIAQYIIENPQSIDELLDQKDLGFGYLKGDKFFVEVKRENENTIKIRSTGVYNGVERSVQLGLLQKSQVLELDKVIYATRGGDSKNPALKIEGSAKIVGDVVANTTGKNSVTLSGEGEIQGNLIVGANADPTKVVEVLDNGPGVSGKLRNLSDAIDYPPAPFPDIPIDLEPQDDFSTPWKKELDYRITQSGHYNKIEVTDGRTLKIDLSEARTIVVHSLKVEGTVELVNVAEGSELKLYVLETFSTSGNRKINYGEDGDPNNLTLYYAGSETFGDAQFKFGGNIVVKNAEIKIAEGCKIEGSIFSHSSKDVLISGGASTTKGLIYAPDAQVAVREGAEVEGAVVASSLRLSGNSRVVFRPEYFDEGNLRPGLLPGAVGKAFAKGTWSPLVR